jgi:glycosidase
MYEVNVRQYTPEGTFNAFSNHLPRLKELGVDILWLMPVNPIGVIDRKGSLGSYYSVSDYKGINPEFGTMADFKSLVKKTHDLGMYLVIDWVPNHSSWDNPLVNQHPEFYAKDSLGNMFSPFDWTDVVQFDYDKQGLRDYMTETLRFWLNETGIDGFRFDVAHQIPIDYWNQLRPDLQETRPDVLMLAEAEDRHLHKKAFDITYAWEFHHIMNSIAKQEKPVSDIRSYLKSASENYNSNDIRMYFTSNHDENSWNGTVRERMGFAAEVMAVLSYGLPGMPLIYSGQEAGLNHRLLFFEKDEILWKEDSFKTLYTDLNSLKNDNQALWNPGFGGELIELTTDKQDKILAFKRVKGENEVVFILNLSPEDQETILEGSNPKPFTDFTTKETTKLGKTPIKIKAWGYKIYYR